MKILSTEQIREWDAYTILNEPIASIDLMERAAGAMLPFVLDSLQGVFGSNQKPQVDVFCGMGNNGGDGLVLARKLHALNFQVRVFILRLKEVGSQDFETNYQRIRELGIDCLEIQHEKDIHLIQCNECIIEALFGSGLQRSLEGLALQLVKHLNTLSAYKIALDLPAGLPGDIIHWQEQTCFLANETLTLEIPKQSLLFEATAKYAGTIQIVPIGLHPKFLKEVNTLWHVLGEEYKKVPSNNFAHKGVKGHALLVAGSYGKAGAAVLASKAALRAGCGLVTSYVPASVHPIIQQAFPEGMVETDEEQTEIRNFPNWVGKSAIGVGPGLGTHSATQMALIPWIQKVDIPVVIDADALNGIAQCLQAGKPFVFPKHSVLTPHPKEFERLFGSTQNGYERLVLASKKAIEHQCIIVLKGAITAICLPNEQVYFHVKSNPLLATAGSGDVLTGIIVSLLAQGYVPSEAAKRGVWIHGKTAQLLKEKGYKHAIAGDFIEQLAFVG